VATVLAHHTDCFQCTLVSLVAVREDRRRRGVARALFRTVDQGSCFLQALANLRAVRWPPDQEIFTEPADQDVVTR
jgi:hypothetical protein